MTVGPGTLAGDPGLRAETEPLPDGDASGAPPGTHLVLEAPGGALLHAVRLPDPEGLVALRGGRMRSFQMTQRLPKASRVRYPAPLQPETDAERAQAVTRAKGLLGLEAHELAERLGLAGASGPDLAALLGGSAPSSASLLAAAECAAAFCVTGSARRWRVSEAYREAGGNACSSAAPVDGAGEVARPRSLVGMLQGNARLDEAAARAAEAAARAAEAAARAREEAAARAREFLRGWGDEEAEEAAPHDGVSHHVVHTAAHVALRGPAAKAAGAVAAFGFEAYNLYHDVAGHNESLESKTINSDQYQERVCESATTASGRAMGGLAGAAMGQAAIPVPLVGAVVGGVVGAACGGFHANSMISGAVRLSGGRAKGGLDLVRCIEHSPDGDVFAAQSGSDFDKAANLSGYAEGVYDSSKLGLGGFHEGGILKDAQHDLEDDLAIL